MFLLKFFKKHREHRVNKIIKKYLAKNGHTLTNERPIIKGFYYKKEEHMDEPRENNSNTISE
mgnify:CR=1 FL=1